MTKKLGKPMNNLPCGHKESDVKGRTTKYCGKCSDQGQYTYVMKAMEADRRRMTDELIDLCKKVSSDLYSGVIYDNGKYWMGVKKKIRRILNG